MKFIKTKYFLLNAEEIVSISPCDGDACDVTMTNDNHFRLPISSEALIDLIATTQGGVVVMDIK